MLGGGTGREGRVSADVHLLLLREEGGTGTGRGGGRGRGRGACGSSTCSICRRRQSAAANRGLGAAVRQLRLKTLYFCIFGLQLRLKTAYLCVSG